ncbi:hypothetical protein M407DRAFT_34171 [Tulasnella calospora MUT 4182]|uniref:Uncharacterized protein n=1 Tax=Tulasnella calospora MUT 4182 TaxID=1051891 RepID=A0A0C3L375_9AGAM|nr:hypothetical protein M407DRAFT_34171 [Tulasnella calospora MUT 4182]
MSAGVVGKVIVPPVYSPLFLAHAHRTGLSPVLSGKAHQHPQKNKYIASPRRYRGLIGLTMDEIPN